MASRAEAVDERSPGDDHAPTDSSSIVYRNSRRNAEEAHSCVSTDRKKKKAHSFE